MCSAQRPVRAGPLGPRSGPLRQASTRDVRAARRVRSSMACAPVTARPRADWQRPPPPCPCTAARHRLLIHPTGLSVWEPTGRSRPAAASTTLPVRGFRSQQEPVPEFELAGRLVCGSTTSRQCPRWARAEVHRIRFRPDSHGLRCDVVPAGRVAVRLQPTPAASQQRLWASQLRSD
jgi:hypothetical protein